MHFNLSKFVQIAKFVAPLVLPAAGVPPELTNLVIHGITVAEGASLASTGAEKKSVAMDAVITGLNAVNAARPGTIDVPQMSAVVSEGIDTTIAAIKAAKNVPTHE